MTESNRQALEEELDRAVHNLKEGVAVEDSAQLLVRHLRARLISYFRHYNFSAADAEDLAQETFRRVFTGIGGLQDESRFRAWFFQIAHNVRVTAHTATARENAGVVGGNESVDLPVVDPAPDPLRTTLQREALSRVWGAVAKLSQQQKQCLMLRVVNEMSYEEIACVLHLSVDTVRTHLREARSNLRQALGDSPA